MDIFFPISIFVVVFLLMSYQYKYNQNWLYKPTPGSFTTPRLPGPRKEYVSQNYTQEFMTGLEGLFRKASNNEPVILNWTHEISYVRNIITPDMILQSDKIAVPILNELNGMEGYKFKRVNYEKITIKSIMDKGQVLQQFEIDMFVQEMISLTNYRILMTALVIFDNVIENNYISCAEKTTPEFPTYQIGYPTVHQWIPLPSEVIITGKIVLGNKTVKYPIIKDTAYLHLQSIEFINSNLTLGSRIKDINKVEEPLEASSLERSKVYGNSTPYLQPGVIYNRWPKLLDEPELPKAWPAVYQPNNLWNSDGIYDPYAQQMLPNYPGISAAMIPKEPKNYSNPTIGPIPRNKGVYAPMFDMAVSPTDTRGQYPN
jgi:hypothetical protein